MTRLPMEQTGESATVDSQRSIPMPMPMPSLMKMYQLVDDPSSDDLISWNEDGTSFIIYRPAEFGRDLLPKYFKHLNFSSFVRGLETHGFRKVVPDRWEFANDGFQRGLLRFVQQLSLSLAVPVVTTPMATVNTVTVNPSLIAALEEENERLRKENMQLYNELLALMSKYGSRFGKAALEYFILCHELQWLELGI